MLFYKYYSVIPNRQLINSVCFLMSKITNKKVVIIFFLNLFALIFFLLTNY